MVTSSKIDVSSRADVPDPVHETFAVALAGGGGFAAFHAALVRKFTDLIGRGCHCVIIERTFVELRYVQTILTPAGARLESVGAHYLREVGDDLDARSEQHLRDLGWIEPVAVDADEGEEGGVIPNWWVELSGPGFVDRAVTLLLVTLVDVHDPIDVEPIAITVFPADSQEFGWVDDDAEPCGGYLAVIEALVDGQLGGACWSNCRPLATQACIPPASSTTSVYPSDVSVVAASADMLPERQ